MILISNALIPVSLQVSNCEILIIYFFEWFRISNFFPNCN